MFLRFHFLRYYELWKELSPDSHVEISLNILILFRGVCLPFKGKLTAPSGSLAFWNAIEIRTVCMAAGSCSPYCLNIVECQGIYIACIYGFVYRLCSKQERCSVPDLYTVRCRADRSLVSDVGRYVYSRVYACARANANVSLIYVHERQTR